MRLLYISPGFAAHEDDDTCIPPLQALVRSLVGRGADVHIIALEYPYHNQSYQWHGATVWPCNGQNRPWKKGITFLKVLWRAKKLLKLNRFDAVHSFWYGMATQVAARATLAAGTPYFVTFMGQDVLRSNKRLPSTRQSDLAEKTKQWIVLSAFHHAELLKNGLDAGHIIPWGVASSDTRIGFPLPAQRNIDVLGVGSLLPVKDWLKWLRTLRLALDQKPDLQAVLIGDGPLRQIIENQIIALGLGEHVRCLGSVSRSEVLGYMQRSKVLLHTAQFESFGYVYVEALQQGCRIVSSPVGIAPELPNAKTSHSDAELANLLLWGIQSGGLTSASVPLTMATCVDQYWKIYDKT